MFKRILIANRGEIAMRILRCARTMGMEVVVVYSKADKDSMPVQMADIAVCIGPAPAKESYLNMNAIVEVAKHYECQAIHPGFGFLSENADFARLCQEEGITFIGPTPENMIQLGDKNNAREIVKQQNVPVVPGSKKLVETAEEAVAIANEIGYPVLCKASAGGGGRGMRTAENEEELVKAFDSAKAEAISCFGNGDMYLEKLIIKPRHIEFQILADNYGNVIHLGERDCSLQRRNQKLMEEAPAKVLTEELRQRMGQDAVAIARAVNYRGVGTVEFILDHDMNYYFIEMNTRVQVEHPITEEITGIDIIREQIKVAAGNRLSIGQQDVKIHGYAIECRINAENVEKNFAPSPGKIKMLHLPAGLGIRVESAMYPGCEVSPFYDSMIAKVIAYGNTRLEAIHRMRVALEELVVDGVDTNATFLFLLTYHKDYLKGDFHTKFLESETEKILNWKKESEAHGR